MNKLFVLIIIIFVSSNSFAQSYYIDARIKETIIRSGHLNMGHPGPKGKELLVNNKYLTIGDKPIIPVMGEVHYTRVNREKWEDVIMKMKANGINIIATYVFWIHHEETEGEFDWSGNRDLRAFIQLCKKHGMWAYPRIGPWCHGEVRNGGLPDWLMKKKDISLRTNDQGYQFYADRLYREISAQLNGLYYKDGGLIIGIQLENEYWRGREGEEHIRWLKQTARKYGMDVPLYTVTGWRNASVPENEVVPLWGGYPAAPWKTDINKIEVNDSYVFKRPINDESIGHKEIEDEYSPDYTPYPFFTCELGIGNQITEHRRPIIDPLDGLAIATTNIATGSNLIGYYVFAGGLNPVGKYSTLEEDRIETGYWNEYPDISYDFQTAIRETGEIAPSYHKVKALHYFLNEFGQDLAPMQPIIPKDIDPLKNLQYALRIQGNSGFLFGSNYYRGHKKLTQKNVQFTLQLPGEKLVIPSDPIEVSDSTLFIWPINMQIDEVQLKYATAHPICRLENDKSTDWYFKESHNIPVEFCFNNKELKRISKGNQKIDIKSEVTYIKYDIPSFDEPIILETEDGNLHRIFILSTEQAEQFWYFKTSDKKLAFLSDANLYLDRDHYLICFTTKSDYFIMPLNSVLKIKDSQIDIDKAISFGFSKFLISHKKTEVHCQLKRKSLLEDAKWLKLSALTYKPGKELYHKQFFKHFGLTNTANIRYAKMYLYSEENCFLRINGHWLNQDIEAGKVNELDLTGYLNKGENHLMVNFPYVNEEKMFSAQIEVEYYNSDRTTIYTDKSWLTTEQYKIPAPWEKPKKLNEPELSKSPVNTRNFNNNYYAWKLNIDHEFLAGFENVYLRLDYTGNKAKCYSGSKLIADNFNNETIWSINLKNILQEKDKTFTFEIEPLNEKYKIYFDCLPSDRNLNKVSIDSCEIVPEYKTAFSIK